jgi:outer membrane protein OmpA-like peptidoglycan-associated protein
MPLRRVCQIVAMVALIGLTSSGCVNTGQKLPVPLKSAAIGAGVGAGVGAVVGSVGGNVLAGAVVGGMAGSVVGLFNQTSQVIISELQKRDIQYVEYGDTHVLILPTDKYFEFNSHRFSDQCYTGLMNIVRLLRFYPCSVFYVAGFTDEIGARAEKNKLSQSRADAVLTFLWAHDVRAQKLRAEGYGDKYDVGDNHLVHGSAYNRRIEIQWVNTANCTQPPMMHPVDSK